MKKIFTFFGAVAFAFLTNCGENKASAADTIATESTPTEIEKAEAICQPAQDADITGEWEMVGSVMDTNDNLQIEENERKNIKPLFKDYMKLNKDGSGAFTVAKLEGRYEVKNQDGGKKYLTWYDKANGRHRVGTIMKVTKDELHIKEPGGHNLIVWKKI